MVEVRFLGIEFDCNCEVLDCILILTLSIKGYSTVIISIWILWIDLNRQGIILDCSIKVIDFVISKATIEKCFEMVWVIE